MLTDRESQPRIDESGEIIVFGTTMTLHAAIVHLSALANRPRGSPGKGALAVSVIGVASLVGRLTTGWLLDRFVATRVSFALLATAALGAFVLARADSCASGVIAS